MFKEARLELTAYYLTIIMAICLIFSVVIYNGATADLDRIERFQRFTSPVIQEIRNRIIFRLMYFNLFILGVSGAAGYYLAGRTLKPIQENLDEQKDFIANASHQLRTPLTALKTELEISLRDPKIKHKKILISNLEEVNKMKKLTDYLLRQSKFQVISELEKSAVNLREVVESAVGKSSKIKTELQDCYVLGNKDSLIELVSILIDNAKKYGGNLKKPIVRVYKNKTIEVQDFGIGIPDIDRPHLFEKFFRGSVSSEREGYGLGLSIAKQIADAHKAKIKVDSKINSGTSFKVIFS